MYYYDAIGRLTSIINRKGSIVLSQFHYTYDANGNIISINDGQTTSAYSYDKLNRLIEIRPDKGNTTTYSYDLRGNRLTENNYNPNDYVNTGFTYYVDNKLKSVTKRTTTTTMTYYSDGLRAKKETASGSTSYIYNLSGKVIAEANKSNIVTANYVWGPDRALVKKETGGGEYYYLYNGHGDVVQIVDRNGNVVNNYNYDEWGNILVSNETVSNPFKYAGEVYDSETGLYYLRARYYDPALGRFINEDSYEGQIDNPLTLNLYSYCLSNPLIYVDPSGHHAKVMDVEAGGGGGSVGLAIYIIAEESPRFLDWLDNQVKKGVKAVVLVYATTTVGVIKLFNLDASRADKNEGASKSVKPEAKVKGSGKHGVKWKEGAARAKDTGKPQGQWAEEDLDVATDAANTLEPGESGVFSLPKGSRSKIYNPDGTTQPATRFWVRNNGTGTWHGYPMP